MNTGFPPPDGTVSIALLGGFSLELNGKQLTDEINRTHKIWGVLTYLLLHRDRPVPVRELLDVFWPNDKGKNPAGALKTLIYRTRALLEPVLGTQIQPILPHRGTYRWNESLPCLLDIDLFERLCREGDQSQQDMPSRIAAYTRALTLYHGDLLPKLSQQSWVLALRARYHALYLDTTHRLLSLLLEQHQYGEAIALCSSATKLDPLDEQLYIFYIRALLCQRNYAFAIQQYELVTERLYTQLGVRPSAELLALYDSIMDEEKTLETDLGVIQAQLAETACRPGAFFCEYGFFREIYRLEARRWARSGSAVHIALLTLSHTDDDTTPAQTTAFVMKQLLDVLLRSLRKGDVVAKYSAMQYVVLLPAINFEDGTAVMERILHGFRRQECHHSVRLSYKIRALDAL